jgi:hypothetical protein
MPVFSYAEGFISDCPDLWLEPKRTEPLTTLMCPDGLAIIRIGQC